MLRRLSIRDFVIVDRLELEFGPGFTALTGETGAGKSILVDALTLVLGARADPLVVRQGAQRADIAATFEVGRLAAARRWLADNDLAGDTDECLIRRVIEPAGRSRGYVNGSPATLAQLRDLAGLLIEIHGQHEHQLLVHAPAQRELLDAYAGCAEAAEKVGELYRESRRLREHRIALETNAAAVAAERDELDWQLGELDAAGPREGEWEVLHAQHGGVAHAASLAAAAQSGVDVLAETDDAVITRIGQLAARLSGLVAYDAALQGIIDGLEAGRVELQDAAHELRRYADRIEVDPVRLREVESRLDAINALARKHRVTPELLPERHAELRARRSELEAAGDLDHVRRLEEAARSRCESEAGKLSAARRKGAARLAERVTAAMQDLAMAGGRFAVALDPLAEAGPHGLEAVEFMVSAHKGLEPLPLARVASGGELSRLALAIQAAAVRVTRTPALVFDEIDAGIGGRVAEIVGRMLKDLGAGRQVMCITHLPQVAAAADQQWRVAKSAAGSSVVSRVTVLGRDERIEELARMLGGVRITETTRRHAAEMLGDGN